MRRRDFLGSCLLPVIVSAGCTEQSGTETPARTTTGAGTETGTQTQTTETASSDSRDVPGWDSTELDASALLDAHVNELSAAESYTADIRATGTQNGDVALEFQLNATQQRVFGTFTVSSRPNREAYLTADRSVVQINGDETTYNTNAGSSIERQFETVAAYRNDDFGISFGDSLEAFEYNYEGTTTFNGDTVFRFSSTGESTDRRAVLLVDSTGVIKSAEFTDGDVTRTHRFTAIGDTSVSPPAWLEEAPQPTTDEPTTVAEDVSPQESDLVIEFEAAQWFWGFTYSESGIQIRNEIIVPVDQPVVLRGTSSDVHHALTIPEYQTTVDAKPDQTDIGRFTPTELGESGFECTEYCGEGHSHHNGTVTVVSQDEFDAWRDAQ